MTTIRASKLARYMVCAGYMSLNLPESEGGEAAREGTACGELLEALLTDKQVGTTASNGVFFDNDMKFYMQPLSEEIKSRAASPILCETRIDWQTKSGIWLRGQYDAAFVDHQGRLCIEDLKYGFGIVEVENNWQLLTYAIGEVIRRGQSFKEISLKIHQPRPHHEDGYSREWVITYEQLLGYKEQIEKRMQELVDGRNDLQTSKQCKYCTGAAEACPAFSRLFYKSLEITTEFHQDSLTEQEIAMQLDQIKRAEEVIKIKLDSIKELALNRIKSGKLIPGYIQADKFSDRKWKTGVTAETIKMLTGKSISEETMLSPFKAEKILDKNLVKSLCESTLIGVNLVKKDSSKIGNKIFGNENPNKEG